MLQSRFDFLYDEGANCVDKLEFPNCHSGPLRLRSGQAPVKNVKMIDPSLYAQDDKLGLPSG